MAKVAGKKNAPKQRPERHGQDVPDLERIRTAKGQRPYFFSDPSVDKLVAMLLALVGEVAVLRERLDTHERLAESETWATGGRVEEFEASDVVDAQRAEWRDAYVGRIMRIITDELERLRT